MLEKKINPAVFFEDANIINSLLSIENIFEDKRIPILIGLDGNEQPLYECLTNLQHVQVSGMTGFGKTRLLRQMVASSIFLNSPRILKIWIFDVLGKASTLKSVVNVVDKVDEIEYYFDYLSVLVTQKEALLKKEKLDDIQSYNRRKFKKYGNLMQYDLVFIDELGLTGTSQKIKDSVMNLCKRGRASGIFLISFTQRFDAKEVGGDKGGMGKSQYGTQISFFQKDEINAHLSGFGENFKELRELGKGEFLYKPLLGGVQRLKSVNLEAGELITFAQKCKKLHKRFNDF